MSFVISVSAYYFAIPYYRSFCILFISGIGYASAIIVFLLNCEYNIILTWAFYYLFSSFSLTLPWSHCDNDWNTAECTRDHRKAIAQNGSDVNMTTYNNSNSDNNTTMASIAALGNESIGAAKAYVADPITEFWEYVSLTIWILI